MARRTRSRSIGRRSRGPGVSWARGVFVNSNVDSTVLLNEFVLFDRTDVSATAETLNTTYLIERVLVEGVISPLVQTTAFQQQAGAYFWMLYVVDSDDTDVTILASSTGGLLQSSRILDMGVVGGVWTEQPAAGTHVQFIHGLYIKVDRKLRAKVKQDELLVLGVQSSANLTGAVGAVILNMFSSVLIRTP